MQNVQALREVKRAEAEVRQLKEQAARQAGEILRESERQATALIERAKADADAAHQQGIQAAHEDVSKQRQKILKAGESDASALRAKVSGPDFTRAVDLIMKNFESRVAGK